MNQYTIINNISDLLLFTLFGLAVFLVFNLMGSDCLKQKQTYVLSEDICQYILIISIFFRKTMIIRSISDELEERIRYGHDNPCRAKKNTNHFFIGNFTILTQLCDFVVVF
jgi:hypothetical protein